MIISSESVTLIRPMQRIVTPTALTYVRQTADVRYSEYWCIQPCATNRISRKELHKVKKRNRATPGLLP